VSEEDNEGVIALIDEAGALLSAENPSSGMYKTAQRVRARAKLADACEYLDWLIRTDLWTGTDG